MLAGAMTGISPKPDLLRPFKYPVAGRAVTCSLTIDHTPTWHQTGLTIQPGGQGKFTRQPLPFGVTVSQSFYQFLWLGKVHVPHGSGRNRQVSRAGGSLWAGAGAGSAEDESFPAAVLLHGPPPASLALTRASLPRVSTRGAGCKVPTTPGSSCSLPGLPARMSTRIFFLWTFLPVPLRQIASIHHSPCPGSSHVPDFQCPQLALSTLSHMCLCPGGGFTKALCPLGVAPSLLHGKQGNFFISQARPLEVNGRQQRCYHHL